MEGDCDIWKDYSNSAGCNGAGCFRRALRDLEMSQQRKEEIQHIHGLNRRAGKTRGKRVWECVCGALMSKIYSD